MQRVKAFFDYLITPQAALKPTQRREARVLLLILLTIVGGGIIVGLLNILFSSASVNRFSYVIGSSWAFALLSIPYFLAWRTKFVAVAMVLSAFAYNLAIFLTLVTVFQPQYPAILIALFLPIFVSSLFLRVPHVVGVSLIQLLALYLLFDALLPEGPDVSFVQSVSAIVMIFTAVLATAATGYRERLETGRQADLARSEQLYRTLLESTFESVMVVKNGRVVEANDSMAQLSGYTWQELVGRDMAMLFAVPNLGDVQHADTVLLHANGTPIPAEVVAQTIEFDGEAAIAYAFRNISERKRAEEALQEAKVLLEEKVRARTAELQALNRGLQMEIARRTRIEDELRRSREDLRALYTSEQKARRLGDTLRDANLSLMQSRDLPVVLDTLLALIAQLVPYDSANILLVDPADNHLVIGATNGYEAWGAAEGLSMFRFSLADFPIMEQIVAERRSVLVADTAVDPRWTVTEPGSHVRSWMGVPLLAGGRVLGLYSLDRIEPDSFTSEQMQLAESLSVQAAMAIENAQLFEEISENRERLRRMAVEELMTVEAERRRLSHALHDETGQALMVLQLALRAVRDGISLDGRPAVDPGVMIRRLDRAIELAAQTMAQLRSMAHFMRPAALDDLGLNLALESFCEEYGQYTDLVVDYHGMEVGDVPESVATSLYRLAQAALTNVVRHAGASTAVVTLSRHDDCITLNVEDDGRGFDASTTLHSDSGIGLIGMRERMRVLGGDIEIHSTPGVGSTICATVQLHGVNEPDGRA